MAQEPGILVLALVVLKSTWWWKLPDYQLPDCGGAIGSLGGPVCTVALGVISRDPA